MRVNARLDEATQEQLLYLIEATGQNASHVLRESVAQYYGQVKGRQRPPSRFLALIGTGDSGRTDIASNVKAQVADIIQRKYGMEPLHPLPESAPPKRSKVPAR